MKKISIWARKNRSIARILVVLLNLMLVVMGMQTGRLLDKMNVSIPAWVFTFVLLIFVSVLFLYPHHAASRSLLSKDKTYRLQKSWDFILAFSSFLMICFLSGYDSNANEDELSFPFATSLYASTGSKPTADEIIQSLKYRSRKDLTRSEKKIIKHEFLKQSKLYVIEKANGNNQIALKIFLTLCTLTAAVGIGYLVAGLACSLSCSGMGGLAVLVAIVGLGGIIFGSIKLIKAISKISGNKQTMASSS